MPLRKPFSRAAGRANRGGDLLRECPDDADQHNKKNDPAAGYQPAHQRQSGFVVIHRQDQVQFQPLHIRGHRRTNNQGFISTAVGASQRIKLIRHLIVVNKIPEAFWDLGVVGRDDVLAIDIGRNQHRLIGRVDRA